MTMKFGVLVPQGWRMDLIGITDSVEAYETMTRVALEAEALGYDSIWLYDHFHTVPIPTQEITFECWTSTAALARDTKRVRIGQMVTCNGYRNPALLAKMASTVDVLSHGRLDFGIGAGWCEQEFKAYGYDFPDGPTRLKQLRDAVQIILKMWSDEQAIFEGQYHSVNGAINQPKGAQKPHIPLLIGGAGEKVTLKLVAQYADACNISDIDNEGLARKFDVIHQHCDVVGRDYNSIRRTVVLNCAIASSDAEAVRKARAFAGDTPLDRLRREAMIGTPDAIRKRVEEVEQAGGQELLIYFPDARDLTPLRMFAEACIPR